MIHETCHSLEGALYLEQSDFDGACLVAVMAKSALLIAGSIEGGHED
jgi:hypothetical protein